MVWGIWICTVLQKSVKKKERKGKVGYRLMKKVRQIDRKARKF